MHNVTKAHDSAPHKMVASRRDADENKGKRTGSSAGADSVDGVSRLLKQLAQLLRSLESHSQAPLVPKSKGVGTVSLASVAVGAGALQGLQGSPAINIGITIAAAPRPEEGRKHDEEHKHGHHHGHHEHHHGVTGAGPGTLPVPTSAVPAAIIAKLDHVLHPGAVEQAIAGAAMGAMLGRANRRAPALRTDDSDSES